MNESGFDFRRYYKSRDVYFKCFSDKLESPDIRLKSHSLYSVSTSLKNSITKILEKYTYGDKKELLKAIIVGEGSVFSEDFETALSKTGTKRFFYPAYLHVFFILLLVGTLRQAVSKRSRDILTVILLLLYAGCQSTHPVMIKCCLLWCIMTAFRRQLGFVHFIDAVSALITAVGIQNPLLLYNEGFVMSIAASLLLNNFYPYSKAALDRIKSGRIGGFLLQSRSVSRIISCGVICTVGLLPLSAYYFNGVTVYSILTALIFIPATAFILAVSVPVFIWIALFRSVPLFSRLMSVGLLPYLKLPYLIEKLPFSYIALPAPGIILVMAFYLGVYIFWRYLKDRRHKPYAMFAVLAGLLLVLGAGQVMRIGTVEINFVNVGQGDGAFIRTPYREVVLVDGGGGEEYNGDYDPGESIYVPYLEHEGIGNIDCAIVSHTHKDHIQGIISAIKRLKVRHVYIPEELDYNEYAQELFEEARKNKTKVHTVSHDTRLSFKSGLTIDMIVPKGSARYSRDENDRVLMAYAKYGDTSCLFTGDMTALSEYNMLRYRKAEKADILKVSHHGSDSANTENFINAVSPDIAVISVGEGNTYGLPSKTVLKRLAGTKLYRTDLNGDIRMIADKKRIRRIDTYK